MAYTKHTWKERLGSKLNRFKDLITGDYLELVNEPTSVTQAGTPIRADWLNEMEQGIADAHTIGEGAQTAANTAQTTANAAIPSDTTRARLGSTPRVRGNTATGSSFLEFMNQNYTARLGFVGFGSTSDSLLNIVDTQGKGILLTSAGGVDMSGPIREEGGLLSSKYAAKSHTHEYAAKSHTHEISAIGTDIEGVINTNPDTNNTFLALSLTEGTYRYVMTNKYTSFNTCQISAPYLPQSASQQFLGFRSRYRDGQGTHPWSPWHRLYPTLYGTGAPPATGGPGQIYIQY